MALRWIVLAVLLSWSGVSNGQVPEEGPTFWCAHATQGGFAGWIITNRCTLQALALSTVENGGRLGWRLTQQEALDAFEDHAQRLEPDINRCGWTTGPFWPEPRVTGPGISSRSGESPGVYTIGDDCETSFGIIRSLYTGCWASACAPIEDEKNLACEDEDGAVCPTANGSNPIHAFSGNKYQAETDFTAGGGSPLRFVRHYNSRARGWEKWSHTYARRIVSRDGFRIAYRDNGRTHRFEPQGSAWVSDTDVTLRLTREAAPDGQLLWVLSSRDNRVERYLPDGRLLSITARGELPQTVEYGADNLIAAVRDGHGRSIVFTHDAEGRIATVTAPDGGSYTYTYDGQDNLVEVAYPDGLTRLYEYTDPRHSHALTAIVDESGRTVSRWEYDNVGRAVASEGAGGTNRVTFEYRFENGAFRTMVQEVNGATRTYVGHLREGRYYIGRIVGDPCTTCGEQPTDLTYDDNGFVKTGTDRNGVVTRFVRDDRGRELERIEAFGTPEQRTITTQWNVSLGVPTRVTEPGRETVYTYDAAGRRLSETVRDIATGETRTTRWTYNAAGQVLTMTGPRGAVTTNTYDNLGNLLTATNAVGHLTQFSDYDGHGNARRITDPNGVVTTLVYDARQRLLSRTAAGATTNFAYDGAGRLLLLTQPNGAFVDYEYDAAGRLVAIEDNLGNRIDYELDLMGNRTAEYVSGPDSVTVRESFSTYDKLNRLINTLGGEGQTMTYAYDPLGNRTATTDALGNANTTRYDALNRVFEQVDALSGVTQYAYNPLDQLTQVVDPRGVTTGYAYNAFGDVLSVASPDAGTTTYAYDTAGNRIHQTDARGVVTEYDYDALNRLVAIRYPDHPAQDIAYTWDAGPFGIGRLSRIIDETGSTEYQYDALGRVTARVSTVRGTTLAHFMEYDQAGNLTSLMHPDGREIGYERDAAGRIAGITLHEPDGTAVPLVSGVAWEPFGGIAGFAYGNGIGHSRTYDLSGRVTDIASGTVQQLAYQWDATDNIAAITDLVDGTRSQSFGYDPLYRLTAASGAYGTFGYGYDAVGNRTALTVDGRVTTYAYAPDSNRLATVDDGTGPVSFEYDAAGNTLTDGRRTFSYDARNRMATADGHAYGYNALGQRVFKPRFQTAAPGDADGDGVIDQNDLLALRDMIKGEIPTSPGADCNGDGAIDNQDTNCIARQIGATKSQGKGKNSDTETETVTTAATDGKFTQAGWILFTYDEAGRLIGEYDETGNPIRRYVWLEDLPVAVISTEGIHYLHVDHLNTPKAVTDPSGAVVWQADYRPFGAVTELVDTLEMNLRFPGQYHDRETGLHQNWHREYVPELGRYSQSDPIGLAGGIATYIYARNSPTVFSDPEGLNPVGIPGYAAAGAAIKRVGIVSLGGGGLYMGGTGGASYSAGAIAGAGNLCFYETFCGFVGYGFLGGIGVEGGGGVSAKKLCSGRYVTFGAFAVGGAGPIRGVSVGGNDSGINGGLGFGGVGGGAARGAMACITKLTCLNPCEETDCR